MIGGVINAPGLGLQLGFVRVVPVACCSAWFGVLVEGEGRYRSFAHLQIAPVHERGALDHSMVLPPTASPEP
jgi:hypothetical protein